MKKLYESVAIAVFGTVVGFGASAQNLVINGDFEEPNLGIPGVWKVFQEYAIPGWSVEWTAVVGSDGNLEFQRGTIVSPVTGAQYVELDSHPIPGISECPGGNCDVLIYQDILTNPDCTYDISFWWRNRTATSGDAFVEVMWDNNLVADSTGLSSTQWTNVILSGMPVTGTSARLEFIEKGTSTTLGTFLDSVSVEEGECGGPPSEIPDVVWDVKFCSNPNAFNQSRATGLVPATVFGSAEVDVTLIDVSSLEVCMVDEVAATLVCGVNPVKSSLEDRGNPLDVDTASCSGDVANPDGLHDLEIKFEAAAICDLIGCGTWGKKDNVPLILKGYLDGQPFETSNIQYLRIN